MTTLDLVSVVHKTLPLAEYLLKPEHAKEQKNDVGVHLVLACDFYDVVSDIGRHNL